MTNYFSKFLKSLNQWFSTGGAKQPLDTKLRKGAAVQKRLRNTNLKRTLRSFITEVNPSSGMSL